MAKETVKLVSSSVAAIGVLTAAYRPFDSVESAKAFLAGYLAAKKMPPSLVAAPVSSQWEQHTKPALKALMAPIYGTNVDSLPLGVLLDAALFAAKRTIKPDYQEEKVRHYKGCWVSQKLRGDALMVRDWLARGNVAIENASENLSQFSVILKRSEKYGVMAQSTVETTDEQRQEYSKVQGDLLQRARQEASQFIKEVCRAVRYSMLVESTTTDYAVREIPWAMWGIENAEVQLAISESALAEQNGQYVDHAYLLELVLFYISK